MPRSPQRQVVTIFGSSRPRPGEPAYKDAYELGKAVAVEGWTVCNGGYGGTMEASAQGARDVNGHTIGVTCSIFSRRGGANRFIVQEVPTFHLQVRLDTLVRLGNAYVALPGGTGTMLEVALVWELLSKHMVRKPATRLLLHNHWRMLEAPIRAAQPDLAAPQFFDRIEVAIEMLREQLAPVDATATCPAD